MVWLQCYTLLMHKWKIIKQRKLLEHKFITVLENEVLLPNGSEGVYVTTPASQHSAAVIALNDKHEVLLQQEYSLGADSVMYQLPGGGVPFDEDPASGAKRELREESGIDAARMEQIGWFFNANRRSNQKQFIFLATELSEVPATPEPGEIIESMWVPIGTVDKMIAEGEIQNINLLAAWSFFKQKISA